MKMIKRAIICIGIILCVLIGTVIMKPLTEDPPSALLFPAQTYRI